MRNQQVVEMIMKTRKATGFKSLRVNYSEINQVISKRQIDFGDKTCWQKTEKVNTVIEFLILELG